MRAWRLCLEAEFTASSALFFTQRCAKAGKAPRSGRHSRMAVTSPKLASWARSSRLHHGRNFSLHTRVLYERLVGANELVLGASVASLRGLDKPPGDGLVGGCNRELLP